MCEMVVQAWISLDPYQLDISVCIGHMLCVVKYFDVSRLQEEQGLFRNNV